MLSDLGNFGGLFAFDKSEYRDPVLVASTDGAGTKVMIAQDVGLHDSIGVDLVAMSLNDVAAMGAKPLFFLDYIVIEKVDEDVIDAIVSGVADACLKEGCALLGGEIAEHPGHLPAGSYDLAGFCVGVAERDRIVDGSKASAGDVVLGIASSGLHSNGFSLVRKVLFEDLGHAYTDQLPGLSGNLGEELLRPTLLYGTVVGKLLQETEVRGLAHVTGGGIPENLERILPEGVEASLSRQGWEVPEIFKQIQALGRLSDDDMFSTFNMGVGMLVVVPAEMANDAIDVIRSAGHRASEIGVLLPTGKGQSSVRIS